MQRRAGVSIGLVGIAAALVLWLWWGRRGGEPGAAGSGSAQVERVDAPSTAGRARPDPKTLARGSIAGTVTGEAGKPVAGARVCARGDSDELPGHLLREPGCATTDAQGHYRIAELLPARYRATAGAPTYRPGDHHAPGDRRRADIQLAPGQHKTGIDIELSPGGVEITGVVSDVTGGAVGHARVYAGPVGWGATSGAVFGESDDHGKFSLWVAPGVVMVSASADGYADAGHYGSAPGTFELLLTPESSLSGIVVDAATGKPIANARVDLEQPERDWGGSRGGEVFSSDDGAFRFDRLEPDRFVVTAHTPGGYGRSEGSSLVGLGQHVEGVVVKLFPAHRLEAKIVISTTRQTCTESPHATLRDPANRRVVWTRAAPDGRLWIDGVLPGTYQVDVRCDDHQPRETYDPVVVADRDVTATWEVDPGGSIRGTVKTAAGAPVGGARVWAESGGKTARARTSVATDQSRTDGIYELTGLAPGTYRLEVDTPEGVSPTEGYSVEVAAGAVATRDLVLEEVGAIQGTVVDSTGAPISGVNIRVVSTSGAFGGTPGQHTDATGAFRVTGQRPGSYRVTASRGWSEPLRKPGTNDDAKQGELVEVRAGQTATVKLVVEARSGTITGVVVDADGKPVADAFVSAARESDRAGAIGSSVSQTRWTWNERPVVTSTEGAFSIGKLSPGTYTVRAYRRGGGEAVAEHVAAGATARLQIQATGSISGTVTRAGGAPIALTIQVASAESGFTRREQFYRTGGRYTVRDLPSGKFRITAEAEGGQGQLELELAEGAQRTGVDLALESLVTVRGRVVEHGTGHPVPGIQVFAVPKSGGGGFFDFSGAGKRNNVSDETGAFTLENVARGRVEIGGFPKDYDASDYNGLHLVRTIDGTGATFDLGDLPILRKRVKEGEPVGELGIHFAEAPPGTPIEKRTLEVSYIDPAGPAARTDLKLGDVITAIDGVDVTGPNRGQAHALLRAAPGTKLALALQRGATVTVVLAAP